MNKRRTKEDFFEELFEKFPEHRDRYDFSRFVFTRMCDKSLIHCNKCGNDFEMSPRGLLDGHNCQVNYIGNPKKMLLQKRQKYIMGNIHTII